MERKDSGRRASGSRRTRNGIVALGDTHGENRVVFNAFKKHPDTNIIHIGDFGIGWATDIIEKSKMKVLNQAAKRENCHLYILRGNHDNPAFWNVKEIVLSNITFVKDRSTLKIAGQAIYFLGGGVSIDRQKRIEGQDYWADEEITEPIKIERKEVDIVITHSGLADKYIPERLHDISGWMRRDFKLKRDLLREQSLLLDLEQDIKSKLWICGHFHVSDTKVMPNRTYIFLGINELRQIALQHH